MIFGFITAFISLLALAKNSIPPSIMGAAITDKVSAAPANPALYFSVFLVIGIAAIIISITERKIIY